MQSRDAFGKNGEKGIAELFKRNGRRVRFLPAKSPCDLLVDGWFLEIKTAHGKDGRWDFNIQRHGILAEKGIDFYVLRLADFPFSKFPLHLLLAAPAEKETISVTLRSLIEGEVLWGLDFQKFCRGEFGTPLRLAKEETAA